MILNDKEQQLWLEGQMYKRKSWGKCKWCKHCYAKTYNGCLLQSKQRSIEQACHRAYERMKSFNELSITRQIKLRRKL